MAKPHRRLNPLTGEWLIVSPHRAKRPWQGQQEQIDNITLPSYDPNCYLCPGNKRVSGDTNPDYDSVFIFDNDHAALLSEKHKTPEQAHSLLQHQAIDGICRVICFSPRHDLTLANMTTSAIEKVITAWQQQLLELSQDYQWIQIFENKGAVMGCSNPHPHGQIWASNFVPNEVVKEDTHQQHYYSQHKTPLLIDYARLEQQQKERIVVENHDWLVVVPYWAAWPYETLLLPKKHRPGLNDLTAQESGSLAVILKQLLMAYDRLFSISFPYSMGWHGAPKQDKHYQHWQLHAHFYPPLLRSATVKKFMVGYEMLAETQRDITAEQAAEKLRTLVVE
ncbi:MAG: UDP-glucose--hexose-1-phosphate uridylyltransferase [Pseudomonadota bacterium]